MFTQRLLAPALQTAGRSIACGTPEVFQNVRNFNQREHSVGFSEGSSHQNLFGEFSSHFRKTEYGSFIKVVSRNFGTSTFHFVREFSTNSNEATHNILCSIPEYRSTTVNVDHTQPGNNVEYYNYALNGIGQDQNISLDHLIKHFQKVCHMQAKENVTIDEQSLSYILMSISTKQEALSFPQLLDILSSAKLWHSVAPVNSSFEQFLQEFERYCARKVNRWTLSQSLLVADYWYILSGSKYCRYLKKMQHAHVMHLGSFSQNQFVQYMFYANIIGDVGCVKPLALQKKLRETIPLSSIKEIGIIAMGLFKCKMASMTTGLTSQIAKKLILEKDNVPDEMIVPILKCLQNANMSDRLLMTLFDEFLHQIDKHNTYVQMHFCHISSSKGIYHKVFMQKLLENFFANLPSLRIKDIERFVYAMMLFNIDMGTNQYQFQLVLEELRKAERISEFNHFPHVFISCIAHLVAAGIYPLDLISAVFQPSMIQYLKDNETSCSYVDIFRSVIQISWSLLLEGPQNYVGYQLDPDLREQLTLRYKSRTPQTGMFHATKADKKIITLNDSVGAFLETASSSIVIILPQFTSADVVFCTNTDGDAVQIPSSYFQQNDLRPKMPVCLEQGIRWNAVISLHKSLMIKPTDQLKGNLLHKIRLLEKMGYVVSLASPVPDNLCVAKKNIYLVETLRNSTLNMDKKAFIADESLQTMNEECTLTAMASP